MKKAYYYASSTKRFVEVKNEDGTVLLEKSVQGKAEARQVAKEAGATPWNF